MQAENRFNKEHLENILFSTYKEISFFDLIRYLKFINNGDNISFNKLFKRLNIEPHLSLSFPSSDIHNITKVSSNNYQIETNFLSLYGVSSPLPSFYTEDLIEEASEGESITKDFYNLFNQSKYKQFFDAFIKYRLSLRLIENDDAKVLNILYSFIGENYNKEINNFKYINKFELLKFSNLFLHKNRSKIGLENLINGYFNFKKIRIEEFIGIFENIPKEQQFSLGKTNFILGDNTHIGNRIFNFSNTFKLILFDLDKKSFNYFQKNNEGYKVLEEIINYYLSSFCNWIVEYQIKEEYKITKLGDTFNTVLGVNTWLKTKKD